MRIVYIVEDITIKGGVERIISDKANRFVREGHHVCIVSVYHSENTPHYPIEKDIELRCLEVNRSRNHTPLETLRIFSQSICRYNRLIKNLHPDVCFYVWILGALLLVFTNHEGRKIYEQHSAYDITPYKLLLRWVQQKADAIVCLTQGDALNFNKSKKVEVIPNFTSIPDVCVESYSTQKAIAVGRLIPIKGFDRLIDNWKKINGSFPDWHLDIYGEGPEKEHLQQQIDKLQLSNTVHLCGGTSDIVSEMAKHSLFCITSHNEGLPMVLCEAQAVGLPAVSFDFNYGASDIITDGKNGWLVPQDDNETFVKVLHEALSSAEKRELFGTSARKMAERFSPEAIFYKWNNLLGI